MPEDFSFHEFVIHHLTGTVLPVVLALLVYWLMGRALRFLVSKTALPNLALKPALVMVRYLLVMVVLFSILAHFGVNVEGVWTVLTAALATIAVGFVALWSVLCNLLCTLLLILFKPFCIGDQIELPPDEIKGEVKADEE